MRDQTVWEAALLRATAQTFKAQVRRMQSDAALRKALGRRPTADECLTLIADYRREQIVRRESNRIATATRKLNRAVAYRTIK